MKKLVQLGIILSFCAIQSACFNPEQKTVVYTGIPLEGSITEISAIIEGVVISQEGLIEQHGHCWSQDTTALPTIQQNKTELGEKTNRGTFQSFLYGLASNTSYNVRGYVQYGQQIIYGDVLRIKTEGKSKPNSDVVAVLVKDITRNSAIAQGRVNTGNNIAQHGHCWVVADVFNSNLPTLSNNFSELGILANPNDFLTQITGLNSNTRYRIRAYAIINGVVVYSGNVISFTSSQ